MGDVPGAPAVFAGRWAERMATGSIDFAARAADQTAGQKTGQGDSGGAQRAAWERHDNWSIGTTASDRSRARPAATGNRKHWRICKARTEEENTDSYSIFHLLLFFPPPIVSPPMSHSSPNPRLQSETMKKINMCMR